MRVDFHMHSELSDGLEPVSNVRAACERLVHWSLTDHDTTAGWSAIVDTPGVVCGVEVSTWDERREVHVVALGIDPAHAGLQAMLAGIRAARHLRADRLADHLKTQGIDLGDVHQLASSADVLTRSHIANAVVAGGHAGWAGQVFQRWLGDQHLSHLDDPAYPSVRDAADEIRAAGGVAVLAHPGHYRDLAVVERLVDRGLDGLEVRHPGLARGIDRALDGIAERRGCLVSCGSDWHGYPGRRPGDHRLPRERVAPLLERLALN